MSTRLAIELTWLGGLVAEEERHAPPPEPLYELRVIATGAPEESLEFDSCAALEAHIARHHPGAEREALPPVPPDEAAYLEKAFALLDHPPEGLSLAQHLRPLLARMLYQWSHPPGTVARLRRELGLPPLAGV